MAKIKEPTVEDWDTLDDAGKFEAIKEWPRWYQDKYSAKQLRDFLYAYVKAEYTKEELDLVRGATPWVNPLDCAIARILSRGFACEKYVTHLRDRKLPYILENARRDIEKSNISAKALNKKIPSAADKPAYKPSIQERIANQVGSLFGVIDGEIDSFLANKCKKPKFDMAKFLVKNQVKGPHVRLMLQKLNVYADELKELLNGKDDQLIEGYSFLTPSQRRKYYDFINEMILAAEDRQNKLKGKRKPRAKKIKSAEQRIAKIKYKEEDTELGIKSVDPKEILGARQVWVYNTKDRFLFLYISNYGMNVKGTTIQDWDEDQSFKKKLRKPEEILPDVVSSGKVKLKKIMPAIRAKETKVTGRVNDEMLIVRVVK